MQAGRTSDFSRLDGVAVIEWDIRTETPLCIKSGTVSAWKQAEKTNGKIRQVDADFDFFDKLRKQGDQRSEGKDDKASLSDFYYNTCFEKDKLQIRYCIPPSSVRGALRNYTIKRLVPRKFWSATDIPKTETDSIEQLLENEKQLYQQQLKEALGLPGWHLIQNLFGLATDSGDPVLAPETVAGRLRVNVGGLKKLSDKDFRRNILSGNFKRFKAGSTHGKMLITTRNPLDRVTQAAKDGGLHSFMELAPGNVFKVTLNIINPVPWDFGLIAFWEQGINQGLLRLGGLTSVGRGRLSITSTRISIFSENAEPFPGSRKTDSISDDILSSLYPEYTIDDWGALKRKYLEKLRTFYTACDKEGAHEQS